MLQRFIELGEGYSDIYELIELARTNRHRLAHLMVFHTKINDHSKSSLCVILHPAQEGDFQPIYICREGIPNPLNKLTKRFELFQVLSRELEKPYIELDIKSSDQFAEKELYFQYLIGILRMNRYIAPLQ